MDDLLTTREVQDLLKVDRITIYRMVQDGRLKGVKIGQQWRFPYKEVEELISGINRVENAQTGLTSGAFPTHCFQTIQNLFSDLGQVGAITVDSLGEPITKISSPCNFCKLMLSSPSGNQACRQSWKNATESPKSHKNWYTCHASLKYTFAPIVEHDEIVAFLLAGQFFAGQSEKENVIRKVQMLSEKHGLDVSQLEKAADEIPTRDAEWQAQMTAWPFKVTQAFQSILEERSGLVKRLHQISEISKITS